MKIPLDQGWRCSISGAPPAEVRVPHDAMLHSPRRFSSVSGGNNGYFEGGRYVYTREIDCPNEWMDKAIYLEFEGVYRNAIVKLNGEIVGEHRYGFTGFTLNLTDKLVVGINQLEVIADNTEMPNCRYYSGGGIYRDVFLHVKDRNGFVPNSLRVKTVLTFPATIRIASVHGEGEVVYTIFDQAGEVASSKSDQISIFMAKLWDDEEPNLYYLVADLYRDGVLVDSEKTTFGIRDVTVSQFGMFVNRKRVVLRGGCVHHDNGILGAASYREAEFRKAKMLKEQGFNAVRCVHNPCSRHFLDACDYYGLYIIDEAFDQPCDYFHDAMDHIEEDLASMVEKDFNHPSVIMYSVGNVGSKATTKEGQAVYRQMLTVLHQLDEDRFVTAGVDLFALRKTGSSGFHALEKLTEAQKGNPMPVTKFNRYSDEISEKLNQEGCDDETERIGAAFLNGLNVVGYNYGSGKYDYDGDKAPYRPIIGSASFPGDVLKNSNYSKMGTQVIGDFMWTAIDYLGQTGLGAWAYEPEEAVFEKPYPWILAEAGAMDLLGTPTAEILLARNAWKLDNRPRIAVRPINRAGIEPARSPWRCTDAIESWSWEGCEGKVAEVEVYADTGSVELYLDDELIGEDLVLEPPATFTVPYRPGTLTARAKRWNGQVVESHLSSAKKPCKITLIHRKTDLKREKIHFIDVLITDADGNVESNHDIVLEVATNAEILAFGSADPKPLEPYFSPKTKTHYGRALLVVRAMEGTIEIAVSGGGLSGKLLLHEQN